VQDELDPHRAIIHGQVPGLLGDPGGVRVTGCSRDEDPPSRELDGEEHVHRPQTEGFDSEEIECQDPLGLPARGDFVEAVTRAVGLVEQAGGDALVFDAVPRAEDMEARLEGLFAAERKEEWTEFLAECGKFEAEIEKEIRTKKFTEAELDEEEQNLERLRRGVRRGANAGPLP
jgi:hypothetical protein